MDQLGDVPGGDTDEDTRADVGVGDDEDMGKHSELGGIVGNLAWEISGSEEEQKTLQQGSVGFV